MRDKNGATQAPYPPVRIMVLFFAGLTSLFAIALTSRPADAAAPITSSGLNTQVNLALTPPPGKVQYDITGGTRTGTSLFHSFGQFNVPTNNIANFLNDSGLATTNILGRVTGGNLSAIYGTIQTTGFRGANLFLMNPAGFLFGPNATVNVGGMVAFTTADYLRLADGVRFNAVPNAAADALLSTAHVAAYGFLGSNPGAITVQGSQLTVADGTGISLVGGNITIQSGTPDGGAPQPARLLAPNGKIQLASAASPGEFDAATLQALPNVDGASFTSFGSVTMAPGSNINVSGQNTVSIRGGQFVLLVNDAVLSTAQGSGAPESVVLSQGSSIVTATSGSDPGADVQIVANSFQMNGATIQSLTTGDGPGGNITITAGSMNLRSGSQITSESDGTAAGGNILLQATNNVALQDGSSILSLTTGDGAGGNITVTADSVNLTSGGTIMSESDGTAAGGNILVQATNVNLKDGGTILSLATGDGAGGNSDISVGESLSLIQTSPLEALPTITSQAFTSKAGDITIQAGKNVTLVGGTILSSADSGSTGLISIKAQRTLSLTGDQSLIDNKTSGSGTNGGITIQAGQFLITEAALTNAPQISTETFNQGGGEISIHATESTTIIAGKIATRSTQAQAGSLEISAPSITIDQGSSLSTRSSGPGNAGGLTLTATTGNLTIAGDSHVRSSSEFGRGSAGMMTVTGADSILLSGGSTIESTSFVSGQAGLMTVSARNLLSLNGTGTGLLSEAQGSGNGVALLVQAPQVQLSNNAIISTRTTGSGNAGNILVKADIFSMNGGATITASSTGSGAAGSVTVEGLASPAQSVLIDGAGSGIFTNTQGTGAGGNIFVNANSVMVQNSGTLSAKTSGTAASATGGMITVEGNMVHLNSAATITTATSGPGNAGDILVKADIFGMSGGSTITAASTGSGQAGTVTIQGLHSPADSVLIDGAGSGIFTDTHSTGAGGNIFVNANSVTLRNGGTVSAATSGTAASATGGTITVEGNTVRLNNGGLITASTTGAGTGGSITISAGSTFTSDAATVSSTATQATGGDINIAASQSVTLNNGSSISASSTGAGNAGSIVINAGQNFFSTDSSVTTEATAPGTQALGGNITVNAANMVQLTNSQINASVQGASETIGGNIVIDPQFVILQNSKILTQATQGQGGNITITTNLLLPDSNSVISASSQFGVNGTVTIQSPISQAGGKIVPLGKSPLLATSLLNQRCAALAGGNFSSFTIAGRDSLPAEPGAWLSSPLAAATLSGGTGREVKGERRLSGLSSLSGSVRTGISSHQIDQTNEPPVLSLRQIAPPGFLTQTFAVDSLAGCAS